MSEEISGNNSGKSFLPVAISFVALALGAAALFVSVNSVKKQNSLESEIGSKADKAISAALESRKLVDELDAIKREFADLKSATKLNSETTIKNFKQALGYYEGIIKENRNLIVANQKGITTLATEIREKPKAVVQAPVSQSTVVKEEEKESSNASGQRTYKVKSGDYFSKIAREFNVSVSDIEKANPNVSSSRLQIGQEIIIPSAE